VEPPRVRAAVRQHHDGRAVDRGVVAFARPRAHLLSVGRIAEDDLSAPILAKTVLPFREELIALRVPGRCAWIEREVELVVEKPKEIRRR